MRSEAIVMPSENVQLLFEEFFKPGEAGCSSGQERSRLSNCQIETFDEWGIEGFRIFGIQECFGEFPFVAYDHSTFHFGDAIIPSSFDDLRIEAFSEVLANSSLIKFVSVGGNEWNTLWICKFGYRSNRGLRVVVIPGSSDGSRPKARPHIHCGIDPRGILFVACECPNFIGLDFPDIHIPSIVSIELPAGYCSFLALDQRLGMRLEKADS